MTTAERLRAEGRAEGHEAGRVEALRDLLIDLLVQRFGGISPEARARVATASADELKGFGLRVVTAGTVAEVLAG